MLMKEAAITIKFPAPLPAEVVCPICSTEENKRGNGCKVCNFNGVLNITVDAKIPIQRGHIIQYISENLQTVSRELTKFSGLVPQVETIEVIEKEIGQYEIVQVSSMGGSVWIANRLDELQPPMYFFNHNDLSNFTKEGETYE